MIHRLKKYLIPLVTLFIIVIFLFLRGYKLEESFFFHNDTGRDYLVLYDWAKTWKPPLLGPQNSTLPFNQSAMYFYFFFPFFVLSRHSLFTTQVTLSVMYVAAFAGGVYALRKRRPKLFVLLGCAFLLSIFPQFVLQSRYVWNPSFVPLFLLAAWLFFGELLEDFSWKFLAGFCLSSALAVGMNLSALPAVLAFFVVSLCVWRTEPLKIGKIVGSLVITELMVFGPFLLFELKYKFQISRRILAAGLSSTTESMSVTEKFSQLHQLLFQNFPVKSLLLGGLILGTCVLLYQKRNQDKLELRHNKTFLALTLLVLTLLFSILSPFRIEAHYIFGPVVFLFILITSLPRKIVVGAMLLCAFFWLQPSLVSSYFAPAPRTIETLNTCFAKYCQTHPEPTFVSVQANFHNYHYGPEFRFLMKENGCQVKDIETEPAAAQQMTVVADGGEYVYGQTSFGEVSMFGEAEEVKVTVCAENLKLYVLKKK